MKLTAITLGLITIVSAGIAGCASKTEGERTLDKAAEVQQAGSMITRGERMVADGKAMEAKGETVRKQGNSTDGDRMVSEGRALQRQGDALIAEGRRLRD